MSEYPVLLNIENRRCVVIGGGEVGRRKAEGLCAAGAEVTVIDPAPAELPAGVTLVNRPFRPDDLDGAFLVVAATGDDRLNASIADLAAKAGALVNVASGPAAGNITLPAVLRRGRITVAVSTGGASPAAAALLRDRIGDEIGEEWGFFCEIAGLLRRRMLTTKGRTAYNQQVLQTLLEQGILRLIAAGDTAGIDRLLECHLGEGISLAELGAVLPKGSS